MSTLYYRWDYVKLLFEMEPDRFHSYLAKLDEIGQKHIGMMRWKNAARVKALGSQDPVKRRYMVTIYGVAAYVVNFLPYTWFPYVRRLDVRATDLGFQDEEVHELRVKLLSHPNPYNIVAQNSQDREKTEKRDAGGKGFSIGSHKSDMRVAMYRRGREPVCLEFQCKDDILERFLNRTAEAFPPQEHSSTFWLEVKDLIVKTGEQRFTRSLAAAGIGPAKFIDAQTLERRALDGVAPDEPPMHTQGHLLFDTLEDYTASTDF